MRNPETAKRLSEAMNRKKMTAKELSDKSGVSESSISQYLHGLFAPRNKTAAKLADVLQVNPMWLMGFDVKMEVPDPFGFKKQIAEENAKREKEALLKKLEDATQIAGTDISNADFVLDMDLLSRDMTLDQMKAVKIYAKFIKASTFDVPDDKKSDE